MKSGHISAFPNTFFYKLAHHFQHVAFIALLLIHSADAQQVMVEPAFPQSTDKVTITFNARECECPLSTTTGPLYAHTGVIIRGNSNWQKVIGTWGDNNLQPRLDYLGDGRFEFEIDPTVSDFYGINPGDVVERLAFVFRSADGGTQTQDLFVDVFARGSINVLAPQDNQIYSLQDTVKIEGVALGADSLALFYNEAKVLSQEAEVLDSYVIADQSGINELEIRGYWDGVPNTEFIEIFVRQPNEIEEIPLGAWEPGFNWNDGKGYLILPAPQKTFVFVQGDFNDWQVSDAYQMKADPDGIHFWIEIEGLIAGQTYGYQYVLDGDIVQPDPYTRLVLDPFNDRFVPSTVFPNLPPYPLGKTQGLVSAFTPGKVPFEWQNDDFERPAPEELLVYELLVRDFVEDHSYQSVMDSLDYIKSLGINALELMPVMEFEGNSSWGYNTSFHFAVDKYYGTEEDLKALVDACHERGIAVILDLVINHAYGQNPLVRMYWEEGAAGARPTVNSPYFNEESPNQVFSFGYDFDHESPFVTEYFNRVLSYWVDEFHVDGYRLDFTKGLTNNPGDGGRYDADRIRILKAFNDHVETNHPGTYMILEHFAPLQEERELTDEGMLVWGNHNYNFGQTAMGYQNGSSFSTSFWDRRGHNAPLVMTYMESHDEERMLYRTQNFGRVGSNHDVRELETSIQRAKMAATMWMSIPGPKLMWMFGELGYDISIDYPCRVCEKPILWEYADDPLRWSLKQHYSELFRLVSEDDIFKTDQVELNTGGLAKWVRLTEGERQVIAVANMDVIERTLQIPVSINSEWKDQFSDGSFGSEEGMLHLPLSPGQYLLLDSEGWDHSGTGGSSIHIQTLTGSDKIKIRSTSSIEEILVRDMMGRFVWGRRGINKREFELLVQDWASGVYLITVSNAEGKTVTQQGVFHKT